ncbi:bacterial transcriptional activator domain-containing protein [Streptomyces sp. NPDC046931]|uniref:bacterial transcriptional activator domain-containing protein n=1 Tax=Streptomyces sp. NPDC046931 TaxID=3154806 RepID=UPI0033FF6FC9
MQQPEQTGPEELIASAATAAPNVSLAAPSDAGSEVFPALLAASTDPSGLRLHSPAPSPAGLEDKTGPDTDPAEASEADECEAHDLHAPEIRVLGPVEVTGVGSTGHGPRMAQLAALLYFRPGHSADVLCADMDPVSPWPTSTLNARMQGLRSSLGSDPAGNLYVPRRKTGEDPYRLSPGVRCDCTRFLQLAESALPLGPSGLTHLEKALALVRGKPFGGRPLPWAEPHQQQMSTRIIDVAHTVATYRIPQGPHHNLNAARHAVATGLDADPTAELLYRDWMRLEAARGNRSGLHTAITRVQQINQTLDCSLETETTQLINKLLNGPSTAVRKVPGKREQFQVTMSTV